MRVYFLSYRRAALKLCGIYVGIIDGFERSVDIDLNDGVFAEIIPENGSLGLNFIIDKKIFSRAPNGCDVFAAEGEIFIRVKKFPAAQSPLKVILQTRQFGCLYTVFSQGDVMLSCDGGNASVTALPNGFSECNCEPSEIGGLPVLAIRGGDGWLCLVSAQGKVVFLNRVKNYHFGNTLNVTAGFETCAAAEACCTFGYDGENLTLINGVTRETSPVPENLLHFAFFESLLTRGDYGRYLSGELAGRAEKFKSYLGEFSGVTVPTEHFYREHGDIAAAGLVYPQGDGIYTIKYFAAEIADGKITNIYPAE